MYADEEGMYTAVDNHLGTFTMQARIRIEETDPATGKKVTKEYSAFVSLNMA